MAGYIGSKAVVVSSGAERKKTFAITTSTTSLTGLSYTPTYVHVFHNGIRLVDSSDYTATNGTSITLSNAAANGDEVVVISYSSFQVADAYNKSESDTRFINTAGDTLTGTLGGTAVNLSGDLSAVNTTLTGDLRGPATFTIDPAVHGNNSGLVIIAGNLQVDGTQTTINSTTLTVDDLNLTLASGAADSAAANGAGITIDGASASLTYVHSGTKFLFNKPLDVTGNIGVTGTVDGVDIQTLNTTAGAALPKAGGTMTGDLQLYKATPIITLKRSDNTTLPGLSWQGAGGVEAASIKMDGTSGTTNSLVMSTHNGSTMAERLRLMTSAAGGITVTGTITSTGTLTVDAGSSGMIEFGNVTTAYGRLYADNSGTFIGSKSNHDLILRTNNTEQVRIDTSGNVGIGETDPDGLLHLKGGTATGDATHILFENTQGSKVFAIGGGSTGITNTNLFFRNVTDNTRPMVITDAGNVGIGIDAPDNKLDVNFSITGEGSQEGGIKIQNARGVANDIAPLYFGVHGGTRRTKAAIGLKREGDYGIGSLIFALDSNGDDANVTFANDEKMRITSAGNAHLSGQIDARIQLSSSGGANIVSDNSVYIRGNDDTAILNSAANGDINLSENGTSRLFIKRSTGNVGIGITGPDNKLHVHHANAALGFSQAIRVSTNVNEYTSGRGGGIVMQNADVNTAGIYGIRLGGWSGALAFYTHTSTSGNTFGTTFTEKMRLGSNGELQLSYKGAALQQADGQAFSIITPASGGGQGIALKRLDSNNDQGLGEISWSNNTQDGQANIRVKTAGAVNTTDMAFDVNNAGTLVTALSIDGSAGGHVKIGSLATGSATSAPLHVAKASTDVQAIFGDNNSSIDDPQIQVIGRNTANNAIRYAFFGLDADANYARLGYNAGAGGFTYAIRMDSAGHVGLAGANPNVHGQAVSVNGRITGGFGGKTTGGTADYNHVTNSTSGNGYTLLTAGATNGPGTGSYYHVFNFEYVSSDGSGNVTQWAIGYNTLTRYQRYRYSGTWSSWGAF